MKATKTFDGIQLEAETREERKMMRDMWNMNHPGLQLNQKENVEKFIIRTSPIGMPYAQPGKGGMWLIFMYAEQD